MSTTPEIPAAPTSLADWERLNTLWKASGLSQSDFCKEQGVNHARFGYWRGKIMKTQRTDENTSFCKVRVKEIPVTSSKEPFTGVSLLFSNGTRLQLPNGLDKQQLYGLIQLLKEE